MADSLLNCPRMGADLPRDGVNRGPEFPEFRPSLAMHIEQRFRIDAELEIVYPLVTSSSIEQSTLDRWQPIKLAAGGYMYNLAHRS
jgi:hypothetical protein